MNFKMFNNIFNKPSPSPRLCVTFDFSWNADDNILSATSCTVKTAMRRVSSLRKMASRIFLFTTFLFLQKVDCSVKGNKLFIRVQVSDRKEFDLIHFAPSRLWLPWLAASWSHQRHVQMVQRPRFRSWNQIEIFLPR
jgi:hypothetical protein